MVSFLLPQRLIEINVIVFARQHELTIDCLEAPINILEALFIKFLIDGA